MAVRFNREWITKEDYKEWLLPEESDNTKARCKLCQKSFSLSNMGEPALKSHAQGSKHKSALLWKKSGTVSVRDFFTKPEDTPAASTSQTDELIREEEKATEKASVSKFVLKKEQHKAEIVWALKSVMSHFSYNSTQDIGDVFRVMFPDSKTAQLWSCGPTKLSYLITFGIAPYVRELLLEDLRDTPGFVLSFDESFNQELQQEQMDFVVRYFHQGKVESRYLTSAFLGHTRAEDLKRKFEEATKDLDMRKLAQVSMDGPNVNWKLLDALAEDRKSQDQYPDFLNVGSCSLHVVHGAFRSGMMKTKWGIDSVLKAIYSLFSESPAKREDFTVITGTDTFPLPFCGHRWLEDRQVAERALEIWPHLTAYITETLKKRRSQIPTTSTFNTVKSAVHDPLVTAKLAFFASTAGIMHPYLKVFQTDAPLLPFVTSELQSLLETLMGKFVKRVELEKANTAFRLVKLDVSQLAVHVAPKDTDIGFAAKGFVDKAVKDKKISDLQVFEFKKECIAMLETTVSKIQERSPLKYSLARKLVCLDPRTMVSSPEEAAKMFQGVLQRLIDAHWKSSAQGDAVLAQYKKFISEARKHHPDKFLSFKPDKTRLDNFLCEVLQNDGEFQDLYCTLQLLLTLSHSQAAVERGFSINKEVLAPNIQEKSLGAIRLVHSFLSAQKIKVANFVITEKLLTSCNNAANRYKMYMLEKKMEKEQTVKGKKRKVLQEELTTAKKRKSELETVAKKLVDTANQKAKEAEKKTDAATMKTLLIQSNASREKAEGIKARDIPAQLKEIKDIEDKLKKLE